MHITSKQIYQYTYMVPSIGHSATPSTCTSQQMYLAFICLYLPHRRAI